MTDRRTFLRASFQASLGAFTLAALPARVGAQYARNAYATTLAERLHEAYSPWGLNNSMLRGLLQANVFELETGRDFHGQFTDAFGVQGHFEWRLQAGRIVGVRQSAYAMFGPAGLNADLNQRELLSMRHTDTHELCNGPVIPAGLRYPAPDERTDSYRQAVARASGARQRWVRAPEYARRFRNAKGDAFVGSFGFHEGSWRTHWQET